MSETALKSSPESTVYDIISQIIPFDPLEKKHIDETLTWIQSGAPIFRIQKPDMPPQHLVSYFVVFDEAALKILLVDHKNAQCWLPSGGNVEINEDPKETVRRECLEELGLKAVFWADGPIFITSTVTTGISAGHTDISLWYIVKGDSTVAYQFDEAEFNDIRWFGFEEIPYDRTDPHMLRFVNKLKGVLQIHPLSKDL